MFNWKWDEDCLGHKCILSQHKTMAKTDFYIYNCHYKIFRKVDDTQVVLGSFICIVFFQINFPFVRLYE